MRTTLLIAALTVLVGSLITEQKPQAAASDGTTVASGEIAINDVAPTAAALFTETTQPVIELDWCPPESEQMRVCTPEGCYLVPSQPEQSVVTAVAPQVAQSAAPVRVYQGQQTSTYRGPFMSRGPVRRGFCRVGRRACRVAFAPLRWIRGR